MTDIAYLIEDLPRHYFNPNAKAAEEILVKQNNPGQHFCRVIVPGYGDYTLFPDRDSPYKNTTCLIKSRIGQRSIKEAINQGPLLDREDEARRLQSISGVDLGYCWSQAIGVELLKSLHSNPQELSVGAQMEEAGFKQNPKTQNSWSKTKDDGVFLYYEHNGVSHLTYEKNRSTGWHNLLLLNHFTQLQDRAYAYPIFWPESVYDPYRAAAGLAILTTEIWQPSMIPTARRKRSP